MTATGPQHNLYISVPSTANLLKPINFIYTLNPTYKLAAPRIDFTSLKMMLSKGSGSGSGSGSELPKLPLPIKQDAQFYSRLLSIKDTSLACPSFRVYYGVASGAVPFLWESQPGIPKHAGTNTFMQPPLSPPPSYFSSAKSLGSKKKRSKMFDFRRNFQKFCHPSPSLSSSSFSSSASSSSSRCRSRRPVVKCLSCFWSNAA